MHVGQVLLPPRGLGLELCGLATGALLERDNRGGDADQHENGHERRLRRLAFAPSPSTLETADRPGQDRLTAEEASQIVRQVPRREVAAARVFLQALEADRLQVAGHEAIERTGTRRLMLEDLLQEHPHAAAKRQLAGQQLDTGSRPAR